MHPTSSTRADNAIKQRLSWDRASNNFSTGDARVILDNGVLAVKVSQDVVILCAAFMAVAALCFLGGLAWLWAGERVAFFILLALTTPFGLAAAWLAWACRPLVLDKQNGLYYRGFHAADGRSRKRQGPLSDICAVQLLSAKFAYCEEDEAGNQEVSHSTLYEINLVCRDGSRIHALNNGDEVATDKAVADIADYLGVPVWHRDGRSTRKKKQGV